MAETSGNYGYGLGNFVRSFMEAKYRSQALDQEKQRVDLSKRNQEAQEAEKGIVYDPTGAAAYQPAAHPDIAPKTQGLVGTSADKPGLIPPIATAQLQAEQASNISPRGLLKLEPSPDAQVPHLGVGGSAETGEPEQMENATYALTPNKAKALGVTTPQNSAQTIVPPAPKAPDQGLINQPAESAPSGLLAQNKPQEEEMSPYIGNYRMSPLRMAEMKTAMIQQKRLQDFNDPQSDISKRMAENAREMFNQYNPGRGDALFKGDLSVNDLEAMKKDAMDIDKVQAQRLGQIIKLTKDQAMIDHYGTQTEIAKAKQAFEQGPKFEQQKKYQDMMAKNAGTLGAARMGQLNLSQNKFATQAQTAVLNEPTIKKYSDLLTQIDSDKALLQSGQKTPAQVATEIGNNLAAIIQRSRSTAVADRDKQAWSSSYGDLNRFKQFLTGSPQNYLTPQFKQALSDQLDRLKGNLEASRGFLAISKRTEFNDANVQRLHDNAIRSFAPDWSPGTPASVWMKGKIGKQGPSSSGPHGSSVIQNGIKYNWNQSTGRYE